MCTFSYILLLFVHQRLINVYKHNYRYGLGDNNYQNC